MMKPVLEKLLWQLAFYGFGLFNFFLYIGMCVWNKSFFRKNTKSDQLDLDMARDELWNLSSTYLGLSHRFFTLRNGLKLHYLTNAPTALYSDTQKPLVLFLHGFPDSSAMWRYILQSKSLQESATIVAVDLPGCGGSDSFDFYSPTEVLEALTEFIVAIREKYVAIEDFDSGHGSGDEHGGAGRVYIVGHDWGCVLGYRLAAEAPCLAHRFILTNAPHVSLAMSNKNAILQSSRKIFNIFLHAPIANRQCLFKALKTLKPLLIQLLCFGYIPAFFLPAFMVKYLGTGGNYAFLRGAQKAAFGEDTSDFNEAESMACTIGPSERECKSQTKEQLPERYGSSVLKRAQQHGTFFMHQTAYYRDGTAMAKWEKSIETIAAFHNIEIDNANSRAIGTQFRKRRSSSASSTLFGEHYAGSLKAPVTVLWGQLDQACTQKICLEGIGDYLARESQVILLPRSGHWTPVEPESRVAISKLIEWLVDGGEDQHGASGDVGMVIKSAYPSSTLLVRK